MATRPKAALFINRLAIRDEQDLPAAQHLLEKSFDLSVHRPDGVGAMAAAVRAELAAGCTLVIAAGGDGTVNLVVNALAGSSVALGLLPLGTANDLAREFKLPVTATAAAQRIVAGTPRQIDLLTVNGIRFCTVGGCGLVARCAQRANLLRAPSSPFRNLARGLGTAIYGLEALREISFHRQPGCQVTLDGNHPASLHGLFVANQSRLGANLKLPANSNHADGHFELCLLPTGSRLRLIAALLALRMGRPLPAKAMTISPVESVRITCADEWLFLGDGEILAQGREFVVELLPRALTVRC
jgi:YegS/Rv2252/BmrU family lipid kinase